jgi:hypothetical protein
MESGLKKSDNFCIAFLEYNLGKRVMKQATSIVERNAKDLIADGKIDAIWKEIRDNGCVTDDLRNVRTLIDATCIQDLFDQNIPKLLEAMKTWSSSRLHRIH